MSTVLDQLHADLSRDLDRIRARFGPGSKVTLIVRNPDVPGDAGVVIGNDDYVAAIAELQLRAAEPPGSTVHGAKRPPIDELIAASSIGEAMRDIAERGIDAHLEDLAKDLDKISPRRRRRRKR